jgi:hypothetical protein
MTLTNMNINFFCATIVFDVRGMQEICQVYDLGLFV